jgi:catechol 2,3-dioxygenase-like lactoylglutathione lyase family enzyme
MGIVGTAHAGVCVADVDEAVAWYRDVLGMTVLSPPYLMEGPEIERDMGEMIPGVKLKGAIVGLETSDHVLELIEYPEHSRPQRARTLTDPGISHIGLVCDDLSSTRSELEGRGVRFLTSDHSGADIAGLRTTWFEDPYGVVFILIEKSDATRPYWRQPRQPRPPVSSPR